MVYDKYKGQVLMRAVMTSRHATAAGQVQAELEVWATVVMAQ